MYEIKYHSKDLKDFSFLVTGGAGFIGSHIVEYLLKYGAGKVRVLDNLATGFLKNLEIFSSHPNLEFINGDIRDLDVCQRACSDIDVVFHQAALGSVPRSIKDPITTNSVNISGFLNMLIASRDQGVKKFIYAASSSAYGDSKSLPKVEDKIGQPLSPYAVTKYVNELYANVFGLNYGIQTIGLRYFNVFGPRQSPKGAYAAVIPLFIDDISKNKKVSIYGDGEQTRDFTFVENAVQANIRAVFLDNPAGFNQVYNVAVGERTSVNHVFEIVKKYAGSNSSAEYLPNRNGDIRDSLADISKIKHMMGYEPTVKLEQGLKITVDWFNENIQFIEKD
jgi:UDP-N-acetylglucosamine 4-epimerase